MTTYFLPIKSMNLAHYLSSGIIAPANYIQNRNSDLQNRFENNLLLCLSKFTDETNCSIEIVLNENEEKPKKISENFLIFNMPLPISRIKSIYFIDEKQKTFTLFNVESGAAFVPNDLIKIANENPIEVAEIDQVYDQTTEVDWNHFLKHYDQILGGFALMKIGKEEFQNYSTHFFKTLGNFNKLFDEILLEQGINLENTFEFAFKDNGKFKTFHDTIYNEISSEDLYNYAEREQIKLEERNGLVKVDRIPENTQTYIVAILKTYGPGKRKEVDSFISDLVSAKFNAKRKEGLALSFGINKGYSVFRNKYKTENFEINIKFELDCKLDYYIIESIYQSIFNEQKDIKKFSFLDEWCPISNEDKIDLSSFTTYRVLDKVVILKKKGDFFLELFQSSLEKRNKLLEIVFETISEALPSFLSFDSNLLGKNFENEFENVAKEYSKFFFDETSKKINTENQSLIEYQEKEISKYKNAIQLKDTEIEELKVKLNAFQNKSKSKSKIEKSNEENLKNYEKSNVAAQKQSNENSISGPLFSDDSVSVHKKNREKELKKFKDPELRKIASNLGIDTSRLRKPKLIYSILEKEF